MRENMDQNNSAYVHVLRSVNALAAVRNTLWTSSS